MVKRPLCVRLTPEGLGLVHALARHYSERQTDGRRTTISQVVEDAVRSLARAEKLFQVK